MKREFGPGGFSLVELLVTLVLAGGFVTAVYQFYGTHERIHRLQQEVVEMRQTARVSLAVMAEEIARCGFDPEGTGLFIPGAVFCGEDDARPDPESNGLFLFRYDKNGDGGLDTNETVLFCIRTDTSEPALSRDAGGGRQQFMRNVEAMGFAFAHDADCDGLIDRSPNGHILWSVDADGDNALDTRVDTNDDGRIDSADTPGGCPLSRSVSDLSALRAVKIWLLARTRHPDPRSRQDQSFVVGPRRLEFCDGFRRILLVSTVRLPNMVLPAPAEGG